jgi:hypothetical protein
MVPIWELGSGRATVAHWCWGLRPRRGPTLFQVEQSVIINIDWSYRIAVTRQQPLRVGCAGWGACGEV